LIELARHSTFTLAPRTTGRAQATSCVHKNMSVIGTIVLVVRHNLFTEKDGGIIRCGARAVCFVTPAADDA
jgi:hypothetical protein